MWAVHSISGNPLQLPMLSVELVLFYSQTPCCSNHLLDISISGVRRRDYFLFLISKKIIGLFEDWRLKNPQGLPKGIFKPGPSDLLGRPPQRPGLKIPLGRPWGFFNLQSSNSLIKKIFDLKNFFLILAWGPQNAWNARFCRFLVPKYMISVILAAKPGIS